MTRILVLPQRPAPDGEVIDHIVASQFPVSDWMEVDEWFKDFTFIRRSRPIHRFGLIFGHQEKDDGKPFPLAEQLAEMKADVMGHFRRIEAERESRRADMLRRVDEFLATFDFVAYGLAKVLDESKTTGGI